jgi:hypothetical protein
VLAQQLQGKVDLTGFGDELSAWLATGLATQPEDRFSDAIAAQRAWKHVVRHVSRA